MLQLQVSPGPEVVLGCLERDLSGGGGGGGGCGDTASLVAQVRLEAGDEMVRWDAVLWPHQYIHTSLSCHTELTLNTLLSSQFSYCYYLLHQRTNARNIFRRERDTRCRG